MTYYPFSSSDYDFIGGTELDLFLRSHLNIDDLKKLEPLDKVPVKRRINLIIDILGNKDLQAYRDDLLVTALKHFDVFKKQLKEYPPFDQQVECIKWHIRFIDHIDSFHLAHLQKILSDFLVEDKTSFHPYGFEPADLRITGKAASVINEIIQSQRDVIHEIRMAFNMLISNSTYAHYNISLFSNGGILTWDDKSLGMRQHFYDLFKAKMLYLPNTKGFKPIYSIICSKIHRTSLKVYNHELSFKHLRDKIEWIGKRKDFIDNFKKLIGKKVLSINGERAIEKIVPELYNIFLIRTVNAKEEINLTTLIKNFKEKINPDFLKTEKPITYH